MQRIPYFPFPSLMLSTLVALPLSATQKSLTLEQVSEVLGLSIGSIRTHYARGKQNLKKRLLEEGLGSGIDE